MVKLANLLLAAFDVFTSTFLRIPAGQENSLPPKLPIVVSQAAKTNVSCHDAAGLKLVALSSIWPPFYSQFLPVSVPLRQYTVIFVCIFLQFYPISSISLLLLHRLPPLVFLLALLLNSSSTFVQDVSGIGSTMSSSQFTVGHTVGRFKNFRERKDVKCCRYGTVHR